MTITANESITKQTHPVVYACSMQSCFYRTAHKTDAEAAADQQRHDSSGDCPATGGMTYLLEEVDERGQRYSAVHMGKSIAEQLWDELDNNLDYLMLGDAEQEYWKVRCGGIAFGIQLMLSHYYPEVDDVTREAVKRHSIRQGKREFEPTPGYKYNPPPVGSPAYTKSLKKMGTDTPKKPKGNAEQLAKPTVSLDDETDAKIRNALKTGLFEDKDLAETFSVTEEYIRNLRSGS